MSLTPHFLLWLVVLLIVEEVDKSLMMMIRMMELLMPLKTEKKKKTNIINFDNIIKRNIEFRYYFLISNLKAD